MEFDFLSFFLGIATGVGISYLVVLQISKMIYKRLAEAVSDSVKEEDGTDRRINLKVEKHGNMLYAFREDNDGFVCQGLTLKELKQQFLEKFPNHVGAIVGASDELHAELIKQKAELKNENSSSQ